MIKLLVDDFEDYMISSITIYPFVSSNKFGKSIYGTSVTTNAILFEEVTRIKDKNDNIVDSNSQLYLNGDEVIDENSKIEFNGKTPEIKKVQTLKNDEGIYGFIVYL